MFQSVCVFLLNECFLLFHLAPMMDLCVFIHACLCAIIIRERACACTSRCVHCCWMNGVSCSIYPWWFYLDTAIKPIYEQTNGPYLTIPSSPYDGFMCFHTCRPSCTRYTWTSVCLHEQMCVCLLNECCLLFHLALMMDLCVFVHACLCALVIHERVCACASRCVHICWINDVCCSI